MGEEKVHYNQKTVSPNKALKHSLGVSLYEKLKQVF